MLIILRGDNSLEIHREGGRYLSYGNEFLVRGLYWDEKSLKTAVDNKKDMIVLEF
jgi:hypothetical protein